MRWKICKLVAASILHQIFMYLKTHSQTKSHRLWEVVIWIVTKLKTGCLSVLMKLSWLFMRHMALTTNIINDSNDKLYLRSISFTQCFTNDTRHGRLNENKGHEHWGSKNDTTKVNQIQRYKKSQKQKGTCIKHFQKLLQNKLRTD